jgi:hypothetical protein
MSMGTYCGYGGNGDVLTATFVLFRSDSGLRRVADMYLYSARITRETVMQFNQERLNKHPKSAKFGANCQLYARVVQHFSATRLVKPTYEFGSALRFACVMGLIIGALSILVLVW